MAAMMYQVRDTDMQKHQFDSLIEALQFQQVLLNTTTGKYPYLTMYKDGRYYGIMWCDGSISLEEQETYRQAAEYRAINRKSRARERRLAKRIALQA